MKRIFIFWIGIALVLFPLNPVLALNSSAPITVVRITTTGATAGNCGSTWASACGLTHALENINPGQEFWVAAGVYIVSDVRLHNNIAIYGGFAGSETSRTQRNWDTNVTTLSGDLGVLGDMTDNANTVVSTPDVDTTAVLDGFTISDANYDNGGGNGIAVWNNSSPTLTNLIVKNNHADTGGGIYIDSSSPVLTNVVIDGNSSENEGGGMTIEGGNPKLMKVTFRNNQAHACCGDTGKGGGLYIGSGSPVLTNVTFQQNSAESGGGLYVRGTDYVLNRATFSNNTATYAGGAIYQEDLFTGTLTNVTISGNTAYAGGGIYVNGGEVMLTNVTINGNSATQQGGGMYNYIGNLHMYDSIVSGNTANNGEQIYVTPHTGTFALSYSIVPSGCPDGSVCNHLSKANPLLGVLGNYGGFNQTIPILEGSPAIDAGDYGCQSVDQRGISRPQGYACDIGAYESAFAGTPIQTFRSVANHDGWIVESSETSNTGGTINSDSTTLLIGDNAVRDQYRSILSFNTGGLPDNAVITKVVLRIKRKDSTFIHDPMFTLQGLMMDIKTGVFGTAALQASDFAEAASKTFGPTKPDFPSDRWYNINLTTAKSYINKLAANGGLTQIRLRLNLDDNNDTVANTITIYSGNAANLADCPQLVITYSIP